MSLIYKICSNSEWEKALEEGFYKGSETDIKDGYIHFSTKEQLKETVDKHFKKQENLIIITFNTTDLVENIKWEPARNGDLFPHCYGFIDINFAHNIYSLELGTDGIHKFPKNFFS